MVCKLIIILMLLKPLEVSYIALNAIDLGLTYYILNNGGMELNPIVKDMGFAQMAIYKTAMTGGFIYLSRWIDNKWVLIGANVFYGIVVGNNLGVTIRLWRQ